MLKSFLCNSKNKDKDAYIWNTFSAMLNAFMTVFILMFISRIDPVTDAGIFTIAFAIGNLMLTIGRYGIRQFQVSDINEKYSCQDYIYARLITCISMILVSFFYIFRNYISDLYDTEKSLVIALICGMKIVDAMEDVFHGMLQQHGRLDIAGKVLSIRLLGYILSFILVYVFTQSLILASGISLLLTILLFLILNRIGLSDFRISKQSFSFKKVRTLLIECFPLFLSYYFVMYISNAPKYAIDTVLDNEAQACFNYIFMPVFVIGLLSQFIYQPAINKLSYIWHEGRIKQFIKLILIQCGIILGLAICAVIGGGLVGIPVLSLIYGVDLSGYRENLVILLIGGGILAYVNFFQMIITVVRKQKWLLLGYGFSYFLFICFGRIIVKKWGVYGISVFYSAVIAVIAVIFLGITSTILFFRIRKVNKKYYHELK